ncbi:MAG: epoxyqueuosine reductase QueH [Alphaproteobacteria bacterium]|nr:epoxyqueuosine reductase QueH [Alphaproteobacteria bacterium]
MSEIKIVLMSCCAPCSAGAITQLKEQGADFIVLFYNPNISPESEYQKRLAEQIKLCESQGIKYAVGQYDHDAWLQCVRGLEDEPERGRRCAQCFKMRLIWGAKWAADNGYNAIASVFGVSRHKSQKQVDDAAVSAIYDLQFTNCDLENKIVNRKSQIVNYIPIDWDESLRQKINCESDFYRQKYCGCEFSIKK